MHKIYGIVSEDGNFWCMRRKLGNLLGWKQLNIHEYIQIYIQQQKKIVYDDTVWGSATVNPKNDFHGGGWEVLSEQL